MLKIVSTENTLRSRIILHMEESNTRKRIAIDEKGMIKVEGDAGGHDRKERRPGERISSDGCRRDADHASHDVTRRVSCYLRAQHDCFPCCIPGSAGSS